MPKVNTKIITAGSRQFVITTSTTLGPGQANEADIPALLAHVAADPTDHRALSLLGRAYLSADRFTEAGDAFTRALAINPGEASYHLHLGRSCLGLWQCSEAMRHCREALNLDPQCAEAYLVMGSSCQELDRFHEAIGHFHAALKIDAALARAYVGVGHCYSEMGWHDKALRCLERAERLQPDSAWMQTEIGRVLEHAERFEEAIARFHAAIAQDETFGPAHAALSTTLVVLGRFPEAMRHAEQAVALGPGHLANPINALVQTGQPVPAETITRAEQMLADAKEGNPLLTEGGTLVRQRQGRAYSAEQADAMVDRLIATFSDETVRRLSGGGLADATPIFVLGMMRSGTTLVEQILSSHPLDHGAGELNFLRQLCTHFDSGAGRSFPENFLEMGPEACGFLGSQYVQHLRALAPEATHIVDKMPANYSLIGAIRCLLPKATIIHCRRHPVDTCLSYFQQLYASPHPETYSLEDPGRSYCAYSRLMEHWRALFADSIHEVVHEELVATPEAEARKLFSACGLPFIDDCLSFFRQERPVRTASSFQVRRPVYRDSSGKWQRYQPYIEELIQTLAPCLAAGTELVSGEMP